MEYVLHVKEVITRNSDVTVEADSLEEAIKKFEEDSNEYLEESETYSGGCMWEYEEDELTYVRGAWRLIDGVDGYIRLAGELDIELKPLATTDDSGQEKSE
ncbi:hypothetical protein [Serratia nevei]|uniref:hypothetical protein n=1 Tax=Serratia nevei TaxID=2703794 RepID=UPI00254B11AD|nr:hypothetical protein [Serratia nevei]MDK5165485.1 hypothetical protein [Serratia nevei]